MEALDRCFGCTAYDLGHGEVGGEGCSTGSIRSPGLTRNIRVSIGEDARARRFIKYTYPDEESHVRQPGVPAVTLISLRTLIVYGNTGSVPLKGM